MDDVEKVFVFLPDTLSIKRPGYIKGFFKNAGTSQAYYITSDQISNKNSDDCIGYVSRNYNKSDCLKNILIYVNGSNGKISFNSDHITKSHVVEIIYDYNGLKNSKISNCQEWGVHFKILSNYLRINEDNMKNNRKTLLTYVVTKLVFFLDVLLKVAIIIILKVIIFAIL